MTAGRAVAPWTRVLASLVTSVALLALAGCATEGVSVRRLPAETPAAANEVAIKRAQTGAEQAKAATAALQAARTAANEGDKSVPPPLTPAEAPSMNSYDPFERINRFTYRFNARFD